MNATNLDNLSYQKDIFNEKYTNIKTMKIEPSSAMFQI